MTVKKFYPTPEGILDDNRYQEKRRGDPEQREKCPEAYLLTVKEAKTLYTIRDIILDVTVKYSGMIAGADPEKEQERIKRNLNPEQIEGIKQDEIITEIERRKISVKLLRNITEKAKAAATWTAVSQFKIGQKGSPLIQEYFLIQTTTPEQIPDRAITPENCPEFYSAENQAEKARALKIPELYLYVSPVELNILHDITILLNKIDADKQAAKENEAEQAPSSGIMIQDDNSSFFSVVSTPLTNAYSSIGANAKKPNITKNRDKTGRQIEITEYLTNLGIKVTFNDFNPNKGKGFVTVGDPNTDKLLMQAQLYAMQTGSKEIEISLSDFMDFRGISASLRKDAKIKAENACDNLYKAGLNVDARSEYASIHGGFRYVQKAFVSCSKGRGGNKICIQLTDDLYNHLSEMKNRGQQIEQIDKHILMLPDNQITAYNIARVFSRNLRMNAGGKNSHKLSVKTLLSYCTILPLYPENSEDAGKENYLRFQSEAPERIIKPFVKALNFLIAADPKNDKYRIFKSYKFTNKSGRPLSEAELTAALDDYAQFTALNVSVVFSNEPDYTHLIENKAKQKAKAEASQKEN